ncbi:MAG: hypothetical protein GY944_29955 [bacterium]|nr:hypothetical protein [bacterium]
MLPNTSPASIQASPNSPISRIQGLIHDLNQELGGQIAQADRPRDDRCTPRHASGLEEIDALIGGGFPIGGLSEISGPASSGRTTLALSLLAQMTRSGAFVAWVDAADAFDPISAQAAGVVLDRVLWARAPDPLTALRAAQCVLETEGFALVGLDLTRSSHTRHKTHSIPESAWLRLTRLVADKRNALILLSEERLAGSRAALALEMQPASAHFTSTPVLLETLETHPRLARAPRMQGVRNRKWKGAA